MYTLKWYNKLHKLTASSSVYGIDDNLFVLIESTDIVSTTVCVYINGKIVVKNVS